MKAKTDTSSSATPTKTQPGGECSEQSSIDSGGGDSGGNGMSMFREYLRGNWDALMSFDDFCQNDQAHGARETK